MARRPKLAPGARQSSFGKASEDIHARYRERRLVGGEGIEPPTLSV
jgi:hypothetical protein